MTQSRDPYGHLDDERLAAFLDGGLTPDERAWAVSHFAACASCRGEMVATRRLLAAQAPTRRPWRTIVPVLVAAAIAFAFVPRFVRMPNTPADVEKTAPPSAERAAQPDGRAVVSVLEPVDQSVVRDSVVVFRWRSVGTDATYHISLQDSTGGVLWEATLGDTSATLPRAVKLGARQQYFWSVDAQLVDGRSARAGVHRFVAP